MIYTPLVKKAAQIALIAHQGRMDKGGYPYIFHPIHLAEQMQDEDSCIVALLHDVVEDSHITFDHLRIYGFSEKQVEAVDALTHRPGTDYMDYIIHQVSKNPLAIQVKLKDLQHNLDTSRLTGGPLELDAEHIERYHQALRILKAASK